MRSATLRQLLAQAAEALREAGVDSPELDARLLAADALRLTPAQLLTDGDQLVPEPLAATFLALVERRKSREPLPYLLGYTEFYGRRFLCDHRALVPRPETELLVEIAAATCAHVASGSLVVEVGLGAGVVALSLALECPHLSVWGTEISPAALELARANAALHRLSERVHLAEGSLLQPLEQAGLAEQIAVVVSNPPYIRSAELASLPPEISVWEPRLALDGGPDGLDVYRALLTECAELPHLQAVFLEVGYDTAAAVQALAERSWPSATTRIHPDLAGLPRVVSVAPVPTAPLAPSAAIFAGEAG